MQFRSRRSDTPNNFQLTSVDNLSYICVELYHHTCLPLSGPHGESLIFALVVITPVWTNRALLVSPAQNPNTNGPSPDHTSITGPMSLHTRKSSSNESMNLSTRLSLSGPFTWFAFDTTQPFTHPPIICTAAQSEDSKSCYPLTKCKPCSKLESVRRTSGTLHNFTRPSAQLTVEWVTTGYKQLEYCTNVKKKFVGCHYSPDFNEERLFWTFEVS